MMMASTMTSVSADPFDKARSRACLKLVLVYCLIRFIVIYIVICATRLPKEGRISVELLNRV